MNGNKNPDIPWWRYSAEYRAVRSTAAQCSVLKLEPSRIQCSAVEWI